MRCHSPPSVGPYPRPGVGGGPVGRFRLGGRWGSGSGSHATADCSAAAAELSGDGALAQALSVES